MSLNLLDLLKDQVAGPLAEQASGFLGEDSSAVTSALGGIFPSLLGGLLDKGSDASGAGQILDLVKGVDPGMLGNIGDLFGGGASSVNGLLNSGGGIVDMIFGDKMGGIVSMISKMSGLKDSSSGSLIKMAAPFLMGIIGKKVSGGGVSGLMDLLMGQKEHVAKALPSGMGSLLGLTGLSDLGSNALSAMGDGASKVTGAAGDVSKAAIGAVGDASKLATGAVGSAASTVGNVGKAAAGTATAAASTGMGWIKWALPLIAIAALAYFLMGDGCKGEMNDATSSVMDGAKDMTDKATDMTKDAAGAVGDAAEGAADAVGDAAGAVGDMVSGAFSKVDEAAKAALSKVTFAAGSAGDKMMKFIDGGFKGEGNFSFNNLNFATGSAAIAGKSGVEVDNLSAILKAYPGVNIEVQGYTDNTGDAAKNVALSQARAEAVKARLLASGISASRMSAKGFGDASPVADNSTAEGRAKNRRIEVKIVK